MQHPQTGPNAIQTLVSTYDRPVSSPCSLPARELLGHSGPLSAFKLLRAIEQTAARSKLQLGRRSDPAITQKGCRKSHPEWPGGPPGSWSCSRSRRPQAERPRTSGSAPFHLLPSPRAAHAHYTGSQHLSGAERAKATLSALQPAGEHRPARAQTRGARTPSTLLTG